MFVHNLQRALRIDLPALQKSAEKILELVLRIRAGRRTQLRRLDEISVLLISDRRMAWLQHGEIFISVETARRHARRFGNSLAEELRLYVVHGLLHLHGFSDRGRGEARKMEVVQKRILQSAGRLN